MYINDLHIYPKRCRTKNKMLQLVLKKIPNQK